MKFKDILKSLNNILIGAVTVLFSLILAFIDYTIPSNATIKMWVIYLVLIACYLICILLYALFSSSDNNRQAEIVKVLSINMNLNLIILSPTSIYKYNMMVSIYYNDNIMNYTECIGIGYVHNIQDDGKIVIKPLEIYDKILLECNASFNNTVSFINQLDVKPFIKYENLEGGC